MRHRARPVAPRSPSIVPVLAAALGLTATMSACGGPHAPPPRYVAQSTSALAEVPYPPPPARVEEVPPRPRSEAVWIDGEWTWGAGRYTWRPGRWEVPPPAAAFAPWTTVRGPKGTLYLAQGAWRKEAP